jgi:hypothetical protein
VHNITITFLTVARKHYEALCAKEYLDIKKIPIFIDNYQRNELKTHVAQAAGITHPLSG